MNSQSFNDDELISVNERGYVASEHSVTVCYSIALVDHEHGEPTIDINPSFSSSLKNRAKVLHTITSAQSIGVELPTRGVSIAAITLLPWSFVVELTPVEVDVLERMLEGASQVALDDFGNADIRAQFVASYLAAQESASDDT